MQPLEFLIKQYSPERIAEKIAALEKEHFERVVNIVVEGISL